MSTITTNLNKEQKEAVTFGDGPLFIIAGAGTGKTTVLTHRIAWLVQEGALHNVRVVDGAEVVDLIVAGEGFLEGSPDEPHYVVNKGTTPAVVMVTFASVEGMPNLVAID